MGVSDIAPNTVNIYIPGESRLLQRPDFPSGYSGFMIQGGAKGIGIGGPGYQKGVWPKRLCQFIEAYTRSYPWPDQLIRQCRQSVFIMVEDSPHLDGQYAAFGKAVEGMEIADSIVHAKRDHRDKPYEDQVMESVSVELNGYAYQEPQKLA